MAKFKLQWHPAFCAALYIEFEDELDKLAIKREHLLGMKSFQIDMLIIKKDKHAVIRKNIGRIFRRHNLIEYKSPGDYLSINHFYKVYGYACFYQSDTARVMEVDPEDITITYVCDHYPRKLIRHLTEVRKLTVTSAGKGIYWLEGDMFPMQILVTKQLSRDENYWLSCLRRNLDPGSELPELVKRYEQQKNVKYYSDLMDLIVKANWDTMKEDDIMCDALRELLEEMAEEKAVVLAEEKAVVLAEERAVALAEERAAVLAEERAAVLAEEKILESEKKWIQNIRKFLKLHEQGCSVTKLASECNMSPSVVQEILMGTGRFSP